MRTRRFVMQNALLVGLLLMGVYFATRSPVFLTLGNLSDVAVQVAILGIVAVTSAILLLAGGVDLSIGSTLALGAVVTGGLIVSGWNPILASLLGCLVGAAVGLFNGVLCGYFDFSPIVVTLGMLTAVRGLTLFIERHPVSDFGDAFGYLGRGDFLGIPVLILISAAVFIIGAVFLTSTPTGRHVYAIGVNREAALLSGIKVRKIVLALYVVTGLSAGLGGVLLASRLNATSPSSLGVGFELEVLTAVLLGGVAFGGGRGNLLGVLVGTVFLGVLTNGLVLLNVFPFVQLIVKGAALVAAAGLDVAGQRLDERAKYRERVKERRDSDVSEETSSSTAASQQP